MGFPKPWFFLSFLSYMIFFCKYGTDIMHAAKQVFFIVIEYIALCKQWNQQIIMKKQLS